MLQRIFNVKGLSGTFERDMNQYTKDTHTTRFLGIRNASIFKIFTLHRMFNNEHRVAKICCSEHYKKLMSNILVRIIYIFFKNINP